ncbi:hypothetical protein CERSUDRAFT_90542 [Gelatoporia subvermispora B]|uniref:Small ribosomal subunit protein mS23 n=1 Tax=Ceriporiopsis subvermispora (strain B) TaxID=914234 RepID=M2QXW3_CERS8|nr:hypothetical protein CERSUDRAFT_90542 [Gelatoporia subvermispora B]
MRRLASQVHKQASRLLKESYLKKPPAWYQAVLDNPPLPLPAKAPPSRSEYDLPPQALAESSKPRPPKVQPSKVDYVEDVVRKQFFRDHPFEAFRATSLVEDDTIEEEHPINGLAWMRLRQRGSYPTPEDAVRFAANLHLTHGWVLSDAYAAAIAQFRALRSEQDTQRLFAAREADHYGVKFGPSQIEITFAKEEKALESWGSHGPTAGEQAAQKRWKMVAENTGYGPKWSRGQDYVRLWKEGVRPSYVPQILQSVITPAGLMTVTPEQAEAAKQTELQKLKQDADFMGVLNQ